MEPYHDITNEDLDMTLLKAATRVEAAGRASIGYEKEDKQFVEKIRLEEDEGDLAVRGAIHSAKHKKISIPVLEPD